MKAAAPKKSGATPNARLTLVVEWDHDVDLPSPDEVEEILDKARETGRVKSATYETLRLHRKVLV